MQNGIEEECGSSAKEWNIRLQKGLGATKSQLSPAARGICRSRRVWVEGENLRNRGHTGSISYVINRTNYPLCSYEGLCCFLQTNFMIRMKSWSRRFHQIRPEGELKSTRVLSQVMLGPLEKNSHLYSPTLISCCFKGWKATRKPCAFKKHAVCSRILMSTNTELWRIFYQNEKKYLILLCFPVLIIFVTQKWGLTTGLYLFIQSKSPVRPNKQC